VIRVLVTLLRKQFKKQSCTTNQCSMGGLCGYAGNGCLHQKNCCRVLSGLTPSQTLLLFVGGGVCKGDAAATAAPYGRCGAGWAAQRRQELTHCCPDRGKGTGTTRIPIAGLPTMSFVSRHYA
jgi:hypothetical protein